MGTRSVPRFAPGVPFALMILAAAFTGQVTEMGAQAAPPSSLEGDWVRLDSNYDPNDQMRIRIEGGVATLTYVPSTGHAGFRMGQSLWTDIRGNGSLKVRGSDGALYGATLTLESDDILLVKVLHSAAGNEQRWRRAGPSIDGEWVRIAPGDPVDGMRIRVERDQGSIRFLPPAAPRNLRVGSRLWREIGSRGNVDVLGSDGHYRPGLLTLEGEDRLWLAGEALTAGQLWVRPEFAEEARITLEPPPPDPRTPGAGLQPPEGIPTFQPPEPGTSPPPNALPACAASSLFRHEGGQTWAWDLDWPLGRDSVAESLGLLDYGREIDQRNYVTTDLEFVRFQTLGSGFSSIAQRRPDPGMAWEERRDLTPAQYEARNREFREAGLRPIDVEAYDTPGGIRYAGVWVTNVEGIDWWAEHVLTDDEYGDLFRERREGGFRLMDMEAYTVPEGRRFAAIWYRSCDNTNWRQWRGMTPEEYQERTDSLDALGYRIVDLESYRTPNGQRYAAIWEQVAGPSAWAVRSGRTLNQYLNFHRLYTDLGFRLVDFEAYETDAGVRYAGVWAENDPRYRYALRPIADDSVEAYRSFHAIPGLSVAIIQGGELVYARGFGWADSAAAKEAHSRTVYPTASIAKAIGGTLAVSLETRGLVDLTRPTADYLDSLPGHHTHTVEQLLAKTGCVPHYDEGRKPTEQAYTWQIDALRTIWADSLLPGCTPGRTYHYSTHGFTYLGAVLEAATGKTLARLLAEEISGPLGLRSLKKAQGQADSVTGGPRDYHLATAYVYDTLRAVSDSVRLEDSSWKVLGGGFQMDARDLAAFGWAHLAGRLFADSIRDNRLWWPLTGGLNLWDTTSALRRAAPSTALGWEATTDGTLIRHGGSTDGARTELRIYPTEGLVIAIMANQRNTPNPANPPRNMTHPPSTLAAQLRRIVLANPPPPRSR